MGRLIAVLNHTYGLYAVAQVKFRPPYNLLPDNRPVVDWNCEQMREIVHGIMESQARKLGLSLQKGMSKREFNDLIFHTCWEANRQGIRIYCLGTPSLSAIKSSMSTAELGFDAEEAIRVLYGYDGFKVLHCHDQTSSEHGFDLVVRHDDTGTLGILEVKAHRRKGRLKTYLPQVKKLGAREMSIPWILHQCELLKTTKPDLAEEIRHQLAARQLERFVIVISEADRQIRFFINENFYDDKIDDYLIGGQYRSPSKEKVREINDELDVICQIAHDMWQTGIPAKVKEGFDEVRKAMRELIAEQEQERASP